ncbi:MAG: sortase [Kiritimatiellae bacterium]|nr:sortase [Kiritimatiellia bacterium]
MSGRRLVVCLAIELGLLAAGALVTARPVWNWLIGTYSRLSASYQWMARVRSGQDGFQPGRPAFWLRIPDCGIDTLVLYGATEKNLRRAPVFMPVGGKLVIAAHRDKHFRRLASIRLGSLVELTESSGRKRFYRVLEVGVLEKGEAEAAIMGEDGGASLFLVTCYPFRYVGPAPAASLFGPLRSPTAVLQLMSDHPTFSLMPVRKCRICASTILRRARYCPNCGGQVVNWGRRMAWLVMFGCMAGAASLVRFRPQWTKRVAGLVAPDCRASRQEHPSSAGKEPAGVNGEYCPPATVPALPGILDRIESAKSPQDQWGVTARVTAASLTPSGFRPPPLGSAVEVVLLSRTTLKGILRELTEAAVVVDTGRATVTIPREQIALQSRTTFFAADYDQYRKSEGSFQCEPDGRRTGVVSGAGQRDIAEVFFRAFE